MRGKSVFSILSITIVIALLTGCIGGSLPGIVPIASGNATIELAPLKDDWAWSYRPDTNRHDENYMVGVRYKLMNGERAEPVIMFDLSGLQGKEVTSAELMLYCNEIQTRGEELTFYSADDSDFTEGELTWNNSPQKISRLSSAVVSEGNEWYSWDVTEFAREKAGGRATFRMVSETGYYGDNSIVFDGRELSNPPKLVVTLGGANPGKRAEVFGFDYEEGGLFPADTRYAAALAEFELDAMGYDATLHYNRNALDGLALMDDADVIVVIGHGYESPDESRANRLGGAMKFWDGESATYISPLNGYGDDAEKFFSISRASMKNTKFVLFLGCVTGLNSEKWGLLTNAAVNNGAAAAAGIGAEVPKTEMDSWTQHFFARLADGETLRSAFENTAKDPKCNCNYKGWAETFVIEGDDSLTLV